MSDYDEFLRVGLNKNFNWVDLRDYFYYFENQLSIKENLKKFKDWLDWTKE